MLKFKILELNWQLHPSKHLYNKWSKLRKFLDSIHVGLGNVSVSMSSKTFTVAGRNNLCHLLKKTQKVEHFLKMHKTLFTNLYIN